MRTYFLKAAVIGLFCFISGCQSTISNPVSTVFQFAPPAEMNLVPSVQDALVRSGDPVIAQVHVQANQKIVILSGYVKKIRQSDVAEQITRKVPGVQNVVNQIIVRP